MPKRLSKKPKGRPVLTIVARGKNPAAVMLGRLGGKKSAKARMEKIAPEERRRIASEAARQRWSREKGDS